MPGVYPLAEQDVPILQGLLQDGPLDGRPLREEVVLRVHALGDQVPPALERHLAVAVELDTNVRAVELLLDDERGVGEEAEGFDLAEVFVVVGPCGAEEVGRPGILDEFVV
jgi:hypothetical protein